MELCNICEEKNAVYDYKLKDGSVAKICQDCGTILYEKDIKHPIYEDRLFQLIAMIQHVEIVKTKTLKYETIK